MGFFRGGSKKRDDKMSGPDTVRMLPSPPSHLAGTPLKDYDGVESTVSSTAASGSVLKKRSLKILSKFHRLDEGGTASQDRGDHVEEEQVNLEAVQIYEPPKYFYSEAMTKSLSFSSKDASAANDKDRPKLSKSGGGSNNGKGWKTRFQNLLSESSSTVTETSQASSAGLQQHASLGTSKVEANSPKLATSKAKASFHRLDGSQFSPLPLPPPEKDSQKLFAGPSNKLPFPSLEEEEDPREIKKNFSFTDEEEAGEEPITAESIDDGSQCLGGTGNENEFRQFVFAQDFSSIKGVSVERSDSGAGNETFQSAAVAAISQWGKDPMHKSSVKKSAAGQKSHGKQGVTRSIAKPLRPNHKDDAFASSRSLRGRENLYYSSKSLRGERTKATQGKQSLVPQGRDGDLFSQDKNWEVSVYSAPFEESNDVSLQFKESQDPSSTGAGTNLFIDREYERNDFDRTNQFLQSEKLLTDGFEMESSIGQHSLAFSSSHSSLYGHSVKTTSQNQDDFGKNSSPFRQVLAETEKELLKRREGPFSAIVHSSHRESSNEQSNVFSNTGSSMSPYGEPNTAGDSDEDDFLPSTMNDPFHPNPFSSVNDMPKEDAASPIQSEVSNPFFVVNNSVRLPSFASPASRQSRSKAVSKFTGNLSQAQSTPGKHFTASSPNSSLSSHLHRQVHESPSLGSSRLRRVLDSPSVGSTSHHHRRAQESPSVASTGNLKMQPNFNNISIKKSAPLRSSDSVSTGINKKKRTSKFPPGSDFSVSSSVVSNANATIMAYEPKENLAAEYGQFMMNKTFPVQEEEEDEDPFGIGFDTRKDDAEWDVGRAQVFTTAQNHIKARNDPPSDSLINSIRQAQSREVRVATDALPTYRPDPSPTNVRQSSSDSVIDYPTEPSSRVMLSSKRKPREMSCLEDDSFRHDGLHQHRTLHDHYHDVRPSCSDSMLEDARVRILATSASKAASQCSSHHSKAPTGVPANAILASMLFRQTQITATDTDLSLHSKQKSRRNNLKESDSGMSPLGKVPPTIDVMERAESVASSVTEEASSFYQKNFQQWKSRAHSALNNYHRNHDSISALNYKKQRTVAAASSSTTTSTTKSSTGRPTWLDRVEEEQVRMFQG